MSDRVILYRESTIEESEVEVAARHCRLTSSRSDSVMMTGPVVFGRYSVLPFYPELVEDLKPARLVNSYEQHKWIAYMDWASDELIAPFTPKTYFGSAFHRLPEGAYVVKGRTNSRKNKWNTHMFAPNKDALRDVVLRLNDDEFISDQGLVIREYVPLKKLGETITGLPVVNEWRTFWYKNQLLASGFYWEASHPELRDQANFSEEGRLLAQQVADIVKEHINFYVLDVAETADGRWILVEINDGQMSGLCGCSAEDLYSSIAKLEL